MLRSRLVALSALVALSTGCGALYDLLTIKLSDPVVPPMHLEYAVDTAQLAETGCAEATAEGGATDRLQITPVDGACRIAFDDAVTVLDETTAAEARAQLQGQSVDAVKSVALIVEGVHLTDEDGTELPWEDVVTGLELRVEDTVLLDQDFLVLLSDGPVGVELPEALVSRATQALADGTPLAVQVHARLDLADAAWDRLPASLTVAVDLQPELEVRLMAAVDAAAGADAP